MVYFLALIFLILFVGAAVVQKAALALVATIGLALALAYISISTGLSAWLVIGITVGIPGILIAGLFFVEEARSKEIVRKIKKSVDAES